MTFDPDALGELERLLAELDQVDAGMRQWAEVVAAFGKYGRKGDPHLWSTRRLEVLAQAARLYCEVYGCNRIEAVRRLHKRYPDLFDQPVTKMDKKLKDFGVPGRSKRAATPAASVSAGSLEELRNQRNVLRDLPPSEWLKQLKPFAPTVKAEAKERQRKHGGTKLGLRAQPDASAGRTRDIWMENTGIGGKRVERAFAIDEAVKADPERLGHLIAEMDANGVNPTYRKLRALAH